LLLPIAAQATSPVLHFAVYFDWGSVEPSPHSLWVIGHAAEGYKNWTGDLDMTVVGQADTSELNAAELSLRRARKVRDALIREGVPAGAITTVGRGAEQLLVPTSGGVRELQNRRVEIELQPKRR